MQEQLTKAIGAALTGASDTNGPAAAPAAPRQGQRMFAAMISARENGCACPPCRLLREELDQAIGGVLKEVSGIAGSPDNPAG